MFLKYSYPTAFMIFLLHRCWFLAILLLLPIACLCFVLIAWDLLSVNFLKSPFSLYYRNLFIFQFFLETLFVLVQSTPASMNIHLNFVFHSFSDFRQSDGILQFLFLVFTLFYWGSHIHNMLVAPPFCVYDDQILSFAWMKWSICLSKNSGNKLFINIYMKSRCFVCP